MGCVLYSRAEEFLVPADLQPWPGCLSSGDCLASTEPVGPPVAEREKGQQPPRLPFWPAQGSAQSIEVFFLSLTQFLVQRPMLSGHLINIC